MLDEMAPLPILPAPNLQRAKSFYGKTLGLELVQETEQLLRFKAGPGGLAVSLNDRDDPARYAVAGWFVDDIQAVVAELRGRGVAFDTFGVPAASGVVELGEDKVAWFKDPFGNVLSVTEAGGAS